MSSISSNSKIVQNLLTPSDFQRRECLLGKPLAAVPKKDRALKTLSFVPQEIIELCFMTLVGEGFNVTAPTIVNDSAASFVNPNLPFYKLTIEIPIELSKDSRTPADVMTIVNNTLHHFLNSVLLKNSPEDRLTYARRITESLSTQNMADNFLKTELSQMRYTVCIGDNFQIEFPFVTAQEFDFTASPIHAIRVGVFQNWIQCVNDSAIRNLKNQVWSFPSPSRDPLTPCRLIVLNMRGFHFTNTLEVRDAALAILRMDHQLNNLTEYQTYLSSQDDLGQLVGYLNWMLLIQNLPENEAKIQRDALHQRERKENPLAQILRNKSHEAIKESLEWIQSILFMESWQPNGAISPSDNPPGVGISATRTRFVTIQTRSLDHVLTLSSTWKLLGSSAANYKGDNYTPVFERLHCRTALAAQKSGKGLKEMLPSSENGSLALLLKKSNITLMQYYAVVLPEISDRVFAQKIWNDQLTTILAASNKEETSKDAQTLLNKLESLTKISDDDFHTLVKQIISLKPSQITDEIKEALIAALFILIERVFSNPTLANVLAIQKLIFNLGTKKIFSPHLLDKALGMLNQIQNLFKFDPKNILHLSLVCEFLYLSPNDYSRSYLLLHPQFVDSLMEQLPQLLKALHESEKQKLVFQIVLTLIKLKAVCIASNPFKEAVSALIIHSATAEIDPNHRIKHAGQEFSLMSLIKMQPMTLISLLEYILPNFNSTQALHRIFMALENVLTPEELSMIYKHLVRHFLNENEKNNPYLELLCRFFLKLASQHHPLKGWLEDSKLLSEIILNEALKRLKALDAGDNERLVYASLFALSKQSENEYLIKHLSQILQSLFAHLCRAQNEPDTKAQENSVQATQFRQYRYVLLAIATNHFSSVELKHGLQKYILIEIQTILRKFDDPAALQALLQPYNRILLQLDNCRQKIENLPQHLAILQNNNSTPIKFLAAFTLFLHRLDPSVTAPLYKILNEKDVVESLNVVYIAISTHLLEKDDQAVLIACDLFTNWVRGHVDVRSESLLNQTHTLLHLALRLVSLPNQKQLLQDILKHVEQLYSYSKVTHKEYFSSLETTRNGDSSLSYARLATDTAISPLLSQPWIKPFVAKLLNQLSELNLVKRGTVKQFKSKACSFDHSLSLQENIDLFLSLLNSYSADQKWNVQLDLFCDRLFQQFSFLERNISALNEKDSKAMEIANKHTDATKKGEDLAQILIDNKHLKHIKTRTILQICTFLVRSNNHALFMKFWKNIPEDFIFLNVDLEYFSEKFIQTGHPEKIQLVYTLCERSHFRSFNLFITYLRGLLATDCQLKIFEVVVERIRKLDKKEYFDERAKQLAKLLLLTFELAYAIQNKIKKLEHFEKLADLVTPLMLGALEDVKTHLPDSYNKLTTHIFHTCLPSKDAEIQCELGVICQQGAIESPTQRSVQFLSNYFDNIDSFYMWNDDFTHKRRVGSKYKLINYCLLNVVQHGYKNRWYQPTATTSINIYSELMKADQIKSMFTLHVASKITKLWVVNYTREVDQKNFVLQPHLVLLQVAKGFVEHGNYGPLKKIDSLYRSLFENSFSAMAEWKKFFVEFLTRIHQQLHTTPKALVKTRQVYERVNLSSFFIKYRPELFIMDVVFLTESIANSRCALKAMNSVMHLHQLASSHFKTVAEQTQLRSVEHSFCRTWLIIGNSRTALNHANKYLILSISSIDMNILNNFAYLLSLLLHAHQVNLVMNIEYGLQKKSFEDYIGLIDFIFEQLNFEKAKHLAICFILQIWYFASLRFKSSKSQVAFAKFHSTYSPEAKSLIQKILDISCVPKIPHARDDIVNPFDTVFSYKDYKQILFTNALDQDVENCYVPVLLKLLTILINIYVGEALNANLKKSDTPQLVLNCIFNFFKMNMSPENFQRLEKIQNSLPGLFGQLVSIKASTHKTSGSAAAESSQAGLTTFTEVHQIIEDFLNMSPHAKEKDDSKGSSDKSK